MMELSASLHRQDKANQWFVVFMAQGRSWAQDKPGSRPT